MSGLIYRSACAIGRPIAVRSVCCIVEGLENIPSAGGVLLAPNHESYFDAMVLSGFCPRPIRWLSAFGRIPVPVRVLLRVFAAIPLSESRRDVSTLRATIAMMRGGELVGGFPEGGIPKEGERAVDGGPMHGGLFKMARLAGVPVIPCAVAGSEVFGHWRGWVPGSGKSCAMVFGPALDPAADSIMETYRASLAGLLGRAGKLVEKNEHPTGDR